MKIRNAILIYLIVAIPMLAKAQVVANWADHIFDGFNIHYPTKLNLPDSLKYRNDGIKSITFSVLCIVDTTGKVLEFKPSQIILNLGYARGLSNYYFNPDFQVKNGTKDISNEKATAYSNWVLKALPGLVSVQKARRPPFSQSADRGRITEQLELEIE